MKKAFTPKSLMLTVRYIAHPENKRTKEITNQCNKQKSFMLRKAAVAEPSKFVSERIANYACHHLLPRS